MPHLHIPDRAVPRPRVYEERGVRCAVQDPPPDLAVLDVHTPSTSLCPWDVYGRKHWREIAVVLGAAGIPCEVYEARRERVLAHGALGGSGPGGRVRSGDEMMPSTYTVAVLPADLDRAREALRQHRAAVDSWLFRSAPMPAVLKEV